MNAKLHGAPVDFFRCRFHARMSGVLNPPRPAISRTIFAAGTLLLLALATASGTSAQPPGAAPLPTIRQAVEAAWSRSVNARAAGTRRDEQAARRGAAASWTPEPPALTLTRRSDELNRDEGAREIEAELEVPLWLPGTRTAAVALADAEGDALEARLVRARLEIAGEVREAIWSLRLAAGEADADERRVGEAEALAADVARRVAAGDLARVDANNAQAAVQQARAALARAQAALRREERLYAALTGLTAPPVEQEPEPAEADVDHHAGLVELRQTTAVARNRLRHASADTRDAPELILGVTRERGEFGERYATTTTVGIRVPFGTDARNRPRIAAASAELVEAESGAALQRERVLAGIDIARAELDRARDAERFSAEHARLAADTRQLLAKAFDLGEIDLPARLRAENDHFNAQLALARARLEIGRAASRLRQAYGLLP